MAESIYTQLENQTVVTPVDGKEFIHPLPSGLFPTAEQFENEAELVSWADENDYTSKLIQKGLQKGIIEVRACFKSFKKDEIWTEAMGLTNIAEMEWKSVNRPNVGGGKAVLAAKLQAGFEIAQAMKDNKANQDLILMALTPTYGEKGAQAIIDSLT